MTLGQDLKLVPVTLLHDREDFLNELNRNVLVEEIAHGVDEDAARLAPTKGEAQSLRPELKVESLFVGMTGRATKAFSKGFRVAVGTTWADFAAASNRVPRRVRPFNCGVARHCRILSGLLNPCRDGLWQVQKAIVV